MHLDLGHVMQSSALIASAIGRNSYRQYSADDSRLDRFLRIDGIEESFMGFCAIG
jgi:hypothetical protein